VPSAFGGSTASSGALGRTDVERERLDDAVGIGWTTVVGTGGALALLSLPEEV